MTDRMMRNPDLSSAMTQNWRLRFMREDDLGAVLVNERASYSHPWSQGIFQDCLRTDYHCWVLERAKQVVGHGILQVAVGEAHILNLCIHPDHQGTGLGRALLRRLLSEATQRNADTAFLEVRESNRPAIRLYEALGFNEIGRRRHYYPAARGREDAIMMARALQLHRHTDEDWPPQRVIA